MALTQVRGSGISNMVISDAGIITKPLQPAFFVTPSTGQTNFAADDSAVTVVFGTEVFDHGGNFASNTFTAPVGGKYQFNVSVCLLNIDTAASNYQVYLVTSNRTYGFLLDPDGYDADVPFWTFTTSVLADMDAADTATVAVSQNGGTAQTDIEASGLRTHFSGYLVA